MADARSALVRDLLGTKVLDAGTIGNPVFALRRNKPFPMRIAEAFVHEDHTDQYLHLLATANVPLDQALHIDGRVFSLTDLLENSLAESRTMGDLSWTVAAYAHYLEPGKEWTNKFGSPMCLGRLAESLVSQGSNVCGGTHALFALAKVLQRPELAQDPHLSKVWPQINDEVRKGIAWLRQSQRPNGSIFPDNWTVMSESDGVSFMPYVYTTGHALEFLALAVEDLNVAWIRSAVDFLAGVISDDHWLSQFQESHATSKRFEYGILCHAVSGICIWQSRAFVEQSVGSRNLNANPSS